MEKETLEEAAKLHAGIPINRVIDEEERYYTSGINEYDSFIEGAKWQAERMYSEEDMREAFKQGHKSARAMGSYNDITEQEDYNKWFEQYKKK